MKAGKPALNDAAAPAARVLRSRGSVGELIDGYKASKWFTDLGPRTQGQYAGYLKVIDDMWGQLPAAKIDEAMCRQLYIKLAAGKPRAAAAVVSYGRVAWHASRTEFARTHPCHIEEHRNPWAKIGVSVTVQNGSELWQPSDLLLMSEASAQIGRPSIGALLHLGWHLGQRMLDLIALPRAVAENQTLFLRQSKTDKRVALPFRVATELQSIVAEEIRRQVNRGQKGASLVLQEHGVPYCLKTMWRAYDEARQRAMALALLRALGRDEGQAENPKLARALAFYRRRDADERSTTLLVERVGGDVSGDVLADVARIGRLCMRWLRATAITEGLKAGLSYADLAALSGHSMRTIMTIADRHYFVPDAEIAEKAYEKRMAARGSVGPATRRVRQTVGNVVPIEVGRGARRS